MSKVNNLAGIIGQRETSVIAAVVDEITAQPAAMEGLKLMPVVDYPAELIYHEKVSGFGGLLGERELGAEGGVSSVSSSQTYEFSPGYYQESKRFTERDLLFLRRLGSMGERGATGLTGGALDFLSRGGMDLKVKVANRLNKLAWDTIFFGTYIYQGVVKYNFNVPSGNTVQAATDWSVPSTSTPFTDLLNIVKINPTFFKYIIKEFVINPVTEAAMLTSAEARTVIINNAMASGDVNKVASILYPGLPTIRVVKEAWQDQVITAGNVVNQAAQYFLPNWGVLAVIDMGGTLYGKYGELQMTYNLNDPNASIEKPSTGIYSFVDEEGLRKRKSPYAEVVTGFNGGPNLMRSNDVLLINTKVGATI